MKQKIYCILVALTICCGSWAEDLYAYKLVKTALTDWRGEYLIAVDNSQTPKFIDGSLEGGTGGIGAADNYKQPGVFEIDSKKEEIATTFGDKYYVVIEAVDDNDLSKGYMIRTHKENANTPYFYRTSNTNGMDAGLKTDAQKYPLNIEFVSQWEINIWRTNNGTKTAYRLAYNGDQGAHYFRFYTKYYKTFLYKKEIPCQTEPAVSAGTVGNVTWEGVTFNCATGITSKGDEDCEITDYGYVWGTDVNPTVSNHKVQCGTTYTTMNTAFAAKDVTDDLTCGQTYHMRTYATNGAGTVYGIDVEFTLEDCPVDYFIDEVQGTTGFTGEGKEMVGNYSARLGELNIDDLAETTSGTCEQVHYHFVGWVTEANRTEPNGHIETLTGNATGTTYYAVWAKEAR